MPLSIAEWANIAAIISAMCDFLTLAGIPSYLELYKRRLGDPYARERGVALRRAMSTYSDREIERIKERIEGCHDRFIKEGSGKDRRVCLCSVLTDVRDGNGGHIPDIDEWPRTFDTLGCATAV